MCLNIKMAASMCKGKVVCSHWIKIGRYYYCSMIGMTYRSVYHVSTSRNVTSITEVRLGRMEQKNFKNERSLSKNKTNCLHRHSANCFHMAGCCDVGKATQSRNYQTRNSNITGISRWYSDDRGPSREKLPSLMDFPEIVWPSIINSLRNWILANLIIRPYFDQEFGLPDFVLGSKQVCIPNNAVFCIVISFNYRLMLQISPHTQTSLKFCSSECIDLCCP
jgi:hypothetical protein